MSCTHKGKIEREYFYQKNTKLPSAFLDFSSQFEADVEVMTLLPQACEAYT